MSSIVAVLVAAALGYGGAQWLNSREGKIRRGPDGQPDLSAPAPRLNGKPNLSGLWQAERTPMSEFVRVLGPTIQPDLNDVTKHVANVFWDVKPTELPLRPEAVALTEQRQKSGRDFQSAYCLPGGLPAATLVLNVKMIQSPDEIVVLHGSGDPARQIYIDGRTLPEHPEPSWMGTSAGHWQDDTLVVETTGFQERAWLDFSGHPRSETMRITERFRRRDVGHMDLEMTFGRPEVLHQAIRIQDHVESPPRRPHARVRLHGEPEVHGARAGSKRSPVTPGCEPGMEGFADTPAIAQSPRCV